MEQTKFGKTYSQLEVTLKLRDIRRNVAHTLIIDYALSGILMHLGYFGTQVQIEILQLATLDSCMKWDAISWPV